MALSLEGSGLAYRITTTKQWIADTFKYGKSPAQVMTEHNYVVMQGALNNLHATRDTLLCQLMCVT